MSFHVGRLAKLYYNTGSFEAPSWVEIKRLGDASLPQSKSANSVVTRESPNAKTVHGAFTFQVTGTYNTKLGGTDSVLTAINNSFFTNAVMDLAAMDRDIATTGATGIRGPFVVTSRERGEPVEGVVSLNLTWDEVDHEEDGEVISAGEYTISGS